MDKPEKRIIKEAVFKLTEGEIQGQGLLDYLTASLPEGEIKFLFERIKKEFNKLSHLVDFKNRVKDGEIEKKETAVVEEVIKTLAYLKEFKRGLGGISHIVSKRIHEELSLMVDQFIVHCQTMIMAGEINFMHLQD